MCDVLQLQPAGAFLRQVYTLRPHSNPITLVGSCTDIDEALQKPLHEEELQQEAPQEPEDFLTSIRRGLEELAEESDEDSDEEDEEGYYQPRENAYYSPSKENTYYSPDQKLPCLDFLDDAPDLSDTSTASSSQLLPWTHTEEDSDDDQEDLIFQLEM
ncbi:hypothetical protein PHMEG_00013606 [Phytophthora megakarya]|uniref:Uncharacterized protein n=1 Tax=Phytophthora megakarya TaxID=4795 RepID=A0A225W7D9_9STRA|nr:hypothetical protein PHMEG_00013606 [Phytophthora megakarya]